MCPACIRTENWVPVSAGTSRTLQLSVSATNKFPSRSIATPLGASSSAEDAAPPSPEKPAVPVPASVWAPELLTNGETPAFRVEVPSNTLGVEDGCAAPRAVERGWMTTSATRMPAAHIGSRIATRGLKLKRSGAIDHILPRQPTQFPEGNASTTTARSHSEVG